MGLCCMEEKLYLYTRMRHLPIESIERKYLNKVNYAVTVQDFTRTICSALALGSLLGIKSGITAPKHYFLYFGLN